MTLAADNLNSNLRMKEAKSKNQNSNDTSFLCIVINDEPDFTDDKNEKIVSTTTAPPKNSSSTVTDTKGKLKGIVEKTLKVVQNISDDILNGKKMGEKVTKVDLEDISLELERTEGRSFQNVTYSSRIGSLEMNSINIDNNTCFTRSLMMANINPYMWDDTSTDVTSSITEFVIAPCNATKNVNRRKKRSVDEDIKPDFSLTLKLKNKPGEKGQFINTTKKSAIHILNMTQDTYPVQIGFEVEDGSEISVFIGYNFRPTNILNNGSFLVPNLNKTCKSNMDKAYCKEYQSCIMLDSYKNTTLFIVVSNGKYANCSEEVLTYTIMIFKTSCKIWDGKQWKSDKTCKILEESTPSKAKFKSNLFGSLAAGLDVAPNLIDFDTVFDNFLGKLADNAAVFGTVIALLVLFIPLGLIVRKMDKNDEKLWIPMPLIDDFEDDKFNYEIHVVTGNKKGAETNSKIFFTVYGTESDTGRRKLESRSVRTFDKGSTRSFTMKTSHNLGSLVCIKIWLEGMPFSLKPYDPWFLSRIIIVDKKHNRWFCFECDQWLSDEHDDFEVERILIATHGENKQVMSELFKKNISKRLTDDHLWLSVGTRRTKSNFTRFQRLVVCLDALFLSMIASCMFYRGDDSKSQQTGIKFGPFTFTINELYVGFVSCLVTFPGLILISLLFNAKKYHRIAIPIAWILSILAALLSAFFTILYSIQWGKEKSLKWMLSFFLSFFQSVLLVQPVKVFLIVFLITFLFKKDSSNEEYEIEIGKMNKLQAENLSHLPPGK